MSVVAPGSICFLNTINYIEVLKYISALLHFGFSALYLLVKIVQSQAAREKYIFKGNFFIPVGSLPFECSLGTYRSIYIRVDNFNLGLIGP